MSVAGQWHLFRATESVTLEVTMECHGSTGSPRLRFRGMPMTSQHAKLSELLVCTLADDRHAGVKYRAELTRAPQIRLFMLVMQKRFGFQGAE